MNTKPPPDEERYEAGPEHPDLFEDPFMEPDPDPRPDAEPEDVEGERPVEKPAKPDDLAW